MTYVNFTQSQGAGYVQPGNIVEANNGSVYRFLGTPPNPAHPNNPGGLYLTFGDFSDQSLWQLIPANVAGVELPDPPRPALTQRRTSGRAQPPWL